MEYSAFHIILILLITAVITVSFCRLLHLPNIIGYLVAGVLAGPYGFGWIADNVETRVLAEFGVVFLLFTIGMEFSMARLLAMRNIVLGLGALQVFTTALIAGLICKFIGLGNEAAFIIGGVMAMSSTAIVIRQLAEQLELHSRHGRQAVGILLFQDLAVIPLLILIPALADSYTQPISELLFWALGKGIIVLIIMLSIGHWLLRPVFHAVAKTRSPDLFMLTVLLFTLAAAWLTHTAGLSLALGAFLAGM
ncbi:MAG: cation:proton antiporter, partial [Gammaproteobacteria bacterium]|nr:cation:proton antiporter [Gammaproteobacteria bacterium]